MSAFVDMLTMVCVEVLQGIRNVENALSSECVTPGGSGDAGDPAFHGFPMDAKREHKRIFGSSSRCKSVCACKPSVDVPIALVSR